MSESIKEEAKEEIVKKPRITIEGMLEYLESQDIQYKGNDYTLIKNLYRTIRISKPDVNSEHVNTKSQLTLSAVEMAKTVDILMEGINKRIRGFDSVGRYQTSKNEMLKAMEVHEYFTNRFSELDNSFMDIVRDAVSKKIVDVYKLPYSIKKKFKITVEPVEEKNLVEKKDETTKTSKKSQK